MCNAAHTYDIVHGSNPNTNGAKYMLILTHHFNRPDKDKVGVMRLSKEMVNYMAEVYYLSPVASHYYCSKHQHLSLDLLSRPLLDVWFSILPWSCPRVVCPRHYCHHHGSMPFIRLASVVVLSIGTRRQDCLRRCGRLHRNGTSCKGGWGVHKIAPPNIPLCTRPATTIEGHHCCNYKLPTKLIHVY
jgi:hypothetical protein